MKREFCTKCLNQHIFIHLQPVEHGNFVKKLRSNPGDVTRNKRRKVAASVNLNGGMEKKHLHTVYTLQGINISHLGKRKIIFKMPFSGDMLVSWRVYIIISRAYNLYDFFKSTLLHAYLGGGAETDLDLPKVQVQDLEFLETWIPMLLKTNLRKTWDV